MTTNITRAEAVLPHTTEDLKAALYTAVGEASTCWETLDGAGVFDSIRAKDVGDRLYAEVVRLTQLGDPSMGLATNAELISELSTRYAMGDVEADYATLKAEQ